MELYVANTVPLRRDWVLYSDSVAAPKKDLIAELWYRNMLHALEAIVEVRLKLLVDIHVPSDAIRLAPEREKRPHSPVWPFSPFFHIRR